MRRMIDLGSGPVLKVVLRLSIPTMLAQLVNVSRQTVSHWENGRAMPDVATAAQLSKVLDVDFMADESHPCKI